MNKAQHPEASPAKPEAATYSIFEEQCRRRGEDPAIELARFKAAEETRQRATTAYLHARSRGEERKPDHLAAILGQLAETLQRSTGPACLEGIQTKEQLRDFLMELLFDEIVSVAQGVLEGMQHERQVEEASSERDEAADENRSPQKG